MYKSTHTINACLVSHSSYFAACRYLSSSRRKFVCHYNILGLTQTNASQRDIKQAYYEKSKQYHPDLNSSSDAALKFQQVNLAYEILSNDDSRKEYDYRRGYKDRVTRQTFNEQDDSSNGDSPETVQFNRRVYSRLRKAASTNKNTHSDSTFYESNQENSRAWKKFKHEEEFYNHLSPDMKEVYQEYLKRVKDEKKVNEEVADNKGNYDLAYVLLLFIGILGIFEVIGVTLGVLENEPRIDKKK